MNQNRTAANQIQPIYWKETYSPMKTILQIFGLGLCVATLSSCDVGAGAYAGARPGYYGHPHPGYYHNNNYNDGYYNNRYYGHNHPTYYRPRSSGVNAGVNARVAPLNLSSSTGLRLF